ncbi:FkbM family methyltransferase [Ideonella sp. DXS22W]|uniref:FkbM family methyltransferase n=1 Tax=Pseudaquabacterium inlustre TaxID=2984192 RepID=A0ABU9CDX8_9BURK
MSTWSRIRNDVVALRRCCGTGLAARWLAQVVLQGRTIIRRGNLLPADQAMGSGPFVIHHPATALPFEIIGPGAFSGIREMYARDTYLRRGTLRIHDGDVVVDLGANMGNFTCLALAHGPRVRVVAVEPSREMTERFRISVGGNPGFAARAQLISAFIGGPDKAKFGTSIEDANYAGTLSLSEEDFLVQTGLTHIDFLKCDIEGAEFGLLSPSSRLLRLARRIAIEIHAFAGSPQTLIDTIRAEGFELLTVAWDPDGTCTALFERQGRQP